VAIIMDGNGRWARARGLPRIAGHREGISSVRSVVETAAEAGVQHLTLYTFSSENWRRPVEEVSALMSLLLKTINREVSRLNENNVQVRTLGFLEDLPAGPRKGMLKAIETTRKNTGLILNLALSYGSRQEIVQAVNRLIAEGCREVDEQGISSRLFTAGISDPDLLIRTGGEFRLSNFLLWQLAYTEIYVTDLLWPEFRGEQLLEAFRSFSRRDRRYGGLSEQIRS